MCHWPIFQANTKYMVSPMKVKPVADSKAAMHLQQ